VGSQIRIAAFKQVFIWLARIFNVNHHPPLPLDIPMTISVQHLVLAVNLLISSIFVVRYRDGHCYFCCYTDPYYLVSYQDGGEVSGSQ
jgi:hypothetical protein